MNEDQVVLGSSEDVQGFIDNFDEGNPAPEAAIGQSSIWSLALCETGEKIDVLLDEEEKHVKQNLEARTIAVDLVSLQGSAWPMGRRNGEVLGLTFALLSQPLTSLKLVEIIGDVWGHLLQFRRQLMAVFDGLWSVIDKNRALGEV